MSQTAKIGVGIAVVVVVALAAGWYAFGMKSGAPAPGGAAVAPVDDSGALPSGSDTSDAAIDKDMASINASLEASASDTSDVDQSVGAASSEQ